MPLRPFLRLAVLSLLAAGSALAFSPSDARAQSATGAFAPFNSWWIHPTQGTLGIFYDGTLIRIDRDVTAGGAPPDGIAESLFLRPTGQQGIPDAAIGSLRLTPSRSIVYAFGGTCNGDGTLVYFYRVPALGTTSNRLEPIVTGHCIAHGIDRVGFYDTGVCAEPNGIGLGLDCTGRLGISQRRVAMFATAANAFGAENFVWFDLAAGVVANSGFDFDNGLGFIHVSPSGTQAFVQHDLPVPGETDYRLIDLCPGTSFGQVINPGPFPIGNSSEQLAAFVTAVSGGDVTIEVRNPAQVVRGSFSLADCLSAGGACCYDAGFCNAGLTNDQCTTSTGSFLGAGSVCDACPEVPAPEPCCFAEGDPPCDSLAPATCTAQGGTPQPGAQFCSQNLCPSADPTLALTGPASGQIGDTLDYAFAYENAGGVVARSVEVQVQLPFGATNVVAPGAAEIAFGTITWALGDVAPGAGGMLAFSFELGCDASYVQLQGSISHTPLGGGSGTSYFPSNDISFEPTPLASVEVAITVASAPANVPLLPGQEVSHRITITNASATSLEGVRVGTASSAVPQGMVYGNVSSFSRVMETGGGSIDTSGNRALWTGDVAAGQTVSFQFVTEIDACIQPGTDETQLNFGTEIAAFDACDTQIGISAEPAVLAVSTLARVDLLATNLAAPQRLDAPIIDSLVQVTRPGGAAEVELALESVTGQNQPNASLSVALRGINVTIPPNAPGTSWNPGTQTITWNGAIPSSASAPATIGFAGNVTACRAEIEVTGSSAPGCTDLRAELLVAAVPEPPPGPWLAGLATRPSPFGGFGSGVHLVHVDPAAPAQVTTMLCLPTEYMQGMSAAPDGTIWAVWLPTWSINPATLAFEALPFDAVGASGVGSVSDVAIDPVDGAVYVSGSRYEPSLFRSIGTIGRRDPVTLAFASYYEDETVNAFGEMVVDPQGSLVVIANRGFGTDAIARIDPAIPPVATFFGDVGRPEEVALDADGSYLVIDRDGNPPAVRDVDPATGAVDVVVADLTSAFPNTFGWDALEVDGAGTIFVAPSHPGLGAIERSPVLSTETLIPISFSGSNAFLDFAMVSQPIPEPGAVLLGAASLAALAAVAARRRRPAAH